MGNHRRKQSTNIHRVVIPEITSLEIWDCITPEGTLWDSMYEDNFPKLLKSVIHQIHSGSATSASKNEINPVSESFDAIYVGGGGAENEAIIHSLKHLPVPVLVAEDPVFSGTPGGNRLLDDRKLYGLIVDIGQTQIKISSPDNRHTIKRDFDSLPIRNDVSTLPQEEQLKRFYQFVGKSIAESISINKKPEGIVLALPCWISADGVLGGSSYTGMKENTELIDQILKHAGLSETSVLLINDAELTSYSACLDKTLEDYKKVLVITLGFGVGAAVLEKHAVN